MVLLGRTERSDQIRQFLLDAVKTGKTDFVAAACTRFEVSRQTIHRHLANLVEKEYLVAEGSTRARKYRLGPIRYYGAAYDVEAIEEHMLHQDRSQDGTIIDMFIGVDSVGRSFVDEVFRVFANRYPRMQLHAINMNVDIMRMVDVVRRPPVRDLFDD